MTEEKKKRPFSSCLTALAGFSALLGGLAAAYAYFVRPRIVQRWGASDEEVSGAMPGDAVLREARLQNTRAVTIEAPPEVVWAWLAQIGYGRAGWYSYDELEEAVGVAEFSDDGKSANQILPQFQEIKAGDQIPTHPGGGFIVDRAEPGRALVLRAKIDPRSGQTADLDEPLAGDLYSVTWAFRLEELEPGSTRLTTRFRVGYPVEAPLLRYGAPFALEPAAFVMERKMLLGIKERAERGKPEVLEN